MKKWQVKRSDFDDGWIDETLAMSYPHKLSVHLNIFTNEVFYQVKDNTRKQPTKKDRNFDRILKVFNERL